MAVLEHAVDPAPPDRILLSAGFLLLIYWLVAAARARVPMSGRCRAGVGPDAGRSRRRALGWCYHFLNGVRHLCWDVGIGFELRVARLSGWAVAIASLALVVLWFVLHGGFGGGGVSLTSPLGRVLGLGSAKEGSRHWYAQRLSAVALAILGIWFFVALADSVASTGPRADVGQCPTTTLLLLMIGTLAWHTILGLQVVIEDYVGSRVCGLRC